MNDPWILERLECEAALMAHHVAHGVPPSFPEPYFRVCRNGHEITSEWDDDPDHGCRICLARRREAQHV